MKRYFFDTEFTENGHTIDPVSIGMVCDDGREFYAEVAEVDWSKSHPWLLDNVKPHLLGNSWVDYPDGTRKEFDDVLTKDEIVDELVAFTSDKPHRPEFWAYYAAYDWVILCQLYGSLLTLPNFWPRNCMDIKQLAVDLGNPSLPSQTSVQHHALNDAHWNFNTYNWLQSYANTISGGLYEK